MYKTLQILVREALARLLLLKLFHRRVLIHYVVMRQTGLWFHQLLWVKYCIIDGNVKEELVSGFQLGT